MAIPQFVLDLRSKIGTAPLSLPSVTAVVFDDEDRILLVRRSDSGRWALVTGCLEPGEQPAVGALREIEEETAVVAHVDRLLSVDALPLTVCPNGDEVFWFDVAFRCRTSSATPAASVNDDESVDVGWFLPEELPELPERERACVAAALSDRTAATFHS